jgi:hypothetical protein
MSVTLTDEQMDAARKARRALRARCERLTGEEDSNSIEALDLGEGEEAPPGVVVNRFVLAPHLEPIANKILRASRGVFFVVGRRGSGKDAPDGLPPAAGIPADRAVLYPDP